MQNRRCCFGLCFGALCCYSAFTLSTGRGLPVCYTHLVEQPIRHLSDSIPSSNTPCWAYSQLQNLIQVPKFSKRKPHTPCSFILSSGMSIYYVKGLIQVHHWGSKMISSLFLVIEWGVLLDISSTMVAMNLYISLLLLPPKIHLHIKTHFLLHQSADHPTSLSECS